MDLTLFVIAAFFLGFIAAIPAGPVQIEVIRRAINGHIKPALMVVFGALLSDVAYGIVAFFGIAPYIEEKKVLAVFWLAGGIILLVLGVIVIRQSRKDPEVSYARDYLGKKRWGFLGGVSLSVANPMMVLWWLSGVRIFRDVGLIGEMTPETAVIFLAAGSLGIASYLSGLSLFLYWAKKFVSVKKMQKINLGFGFLLLLLAGYFLYTSLAAVTHL